MKRKFFTMAIVSAISSLSVTESRSKANVYNEYNTLKEVLLGTANMLYFPQSHDIEKEENATGISKFLSRRIYPMFSGKKVPNWIAKKFRKEEETLLKILIDHGVKVHRPNDVVPLPDEPIGLGQMFSRDPIITVGNTILNSQLQIPMRRKENRGFDSLLQKLSSNGVQVEKHRELNTFLEGGDVIVNYPYIFVGQSKYGSNQNGIDWLKKIVGDSFEIIPVIITDPSVLHLDCAMTIIGNNKGIIHRKSLQAELSKPLSDYDFIEVDDKTAKQLGTNVLVINPQTVVVQKRHKKLIKSLSENGYKVIPICFTWHTLLGGAFRCATSPINRSHE